MTSPMHSPLQSPLQPVMRSPLEFRRRGGVAFDIASTNPSAYYDRTNLATLFQDSAGTTPVTATGQPIGLGLDQSQGLALGPERIVDPANANFTSDTGFWSLDNAQVTISGGELNFDSPPINTGMSRNDGALISAQGYFEIVVDISSISSGGLRVYCGGSLVPIPASAGIHTIRVFPAGNYYYGIQATTANTVASVTSTSIKLLAGNHQSQATAGKRPIADGSPIYANFDAVDDDLVAVFPASLGAGCTVCRSLPGTGASITTGVTLTDTFTDDVDAHALLIYTAAQWAALDAGQIANITTWLNGRAGL